jgi:prepilin-type N-terminal cleavage/methylation domain-containing protein
MDCQFGKCGPSMVGRRRSHERLGFTLVELLVSVAILGVLISVIVAMTSGFLGFSRRVSNINTQLADLNDVLGYVALNARRAMRVVGASDQVRIDPPDGAEFDCSIGSVHGPCIALVVPITNRANSEITGYTLVAYRVAPLSTWGSNPGIAVGWNGDATPALFEYTTPLACGAGCAVPTVAGTTVSATRTSLVLSDLFLVDEAGAPVEPFEVAAAESKITFRLRTRGVGLEGQVLVPSDRPLEILTLRRP